MCRVGAFGILNVDCEGNFSTYSPELLGLGSPHYGEFALGHVASKSELRLRQIRWHQTVPGEVIAVFDGIGPGP